MTKEAAAELARIQKTYKVDPDFRRYVDGYCKSKNVQVDAALQHEIVKEVGRYYIAENIKQQTAKIFCTEYLYSEMEYQQKQAAEQDRYKNIETENTEVLALVSKA